MNRFKLFKIFCLILSIGAACYYPVKKVMMYEFSPAQEFDFKAEGYDPYDPGRGHFLALKVYPDKIDNAIAEKYAPGKTPYVLVGKDQNGLATITGFAAAPGNTPCFKANQALVFGGRIERLYPFNRFYINEELAQDAERILEDAVNSKKTCVLRVKLYPDGASAVSSLLIDGRDIRELARAKQAEK